MLDTLFNQIENKLNQVESIRRSNVFMAIHLWLRMYGYVCVGINIYMAMYDYVCMAMYV